MIEPEAVHDARKPFFWTEPGSCANELAVTMTAYTGPVQTQARQTPSLEKGLTIKPLVEVLLATESCQEESQFSLRMWVVLALLEGLHIQEHRVSANWTQWASKKSQKWGGQTRRGGGSGRNWGKEVNMNKIHRIKISGN